MLSRPLTIERETLGWPMIELNIVTNVKDVGKYYQ